MREERRTGETRPLARPPSVHPQRFPKSARLARSAEFRKIKNEGESFHGKFIVLSVLKTSQVEPARAGFITSRRVGGAVERNHVRRRLRELVRLTRRKLREGVWLVLIARAAAREASWHALHDEWLALAERASILNA